MKWITFLTFILAVGCSNNPTETIYIESGSSNIITVISISGTRAGADIYADYQLVAQLSTTSGSKDTVKVADGAYLRAKITRSGTFYSKDTVAFDGLEWDL